MPGRKETPVHSLFNVIESETYKGKRAVCLFCSTEVSNNGTRKKQHILYCLKCGDDIKIRFLGKKTVNAAKPLKRKQSKLGQNKHFRRITYSAKGVYIQAFPLTCIIVYL